MGKVVLNKKLTKIVGKFNVEHRLIQEGDRVLVGLSGGKDSLALVHILKYMQQHAPFEFEFEACTINYGMEDENYSYLRDHCKEHNIKHTIYNTNIYKVANETIRENSSFCSYFSRMRRGALYSFAVENGFNKVALGHHFDDMVESFFMNMFYNGTIRAMAPIYKTSKGFHLIRPMILVRERQLISFARENNLQTIGDEACPAMLKKIKVPYARAEIKEWLSSLEKDRKGVFKMIQASFKHIHDDTLLDKKRWIRDDI